MQRIYLPNTDFQQILSISDKEIYHQLIKVLRMKLDQEVVFFDGESMQDNMYKIVSISRKDIQFEKTQTIEKDSELIFELNLFQALPNKFSKLEYIVQKCVEVGYTKIVFFSSERSQKLHLSDNKIQRLHTIAKEAIEQCGRNKIIDIVLDSIHDDSADMKILFHPYTEKKLSDITIKKGQSISVYVGPEGGFLDAELERFYSQGIQSITLGNRILRSETVGAVTGFFLSQ